MLTKEDKIWKCATGHSFDIARKGYVNLLPPNKKSSNDPGDNDEMIKARRLIMDMGYYSRLVDFLAKKVDFLPHSTILDLGCGEGIITRGLASLGDTAGVDISKHAIERAAAVDKKSTYVVASGNSLPFADNSIDLVVNCFAPLKENEVLRVLTENGNLIKITPAPMHLYELKQAIYPNVYQNDEDITPNGFTLVDNYIVKDKITVKGESLKALLQMTPYYYKTPKELLDNIADKEITTSLEFAVRVLNSKN